MRNFRKTDRFSALISEGLSQHRIKNYSDADFILQLFAEFGYYTPSCEAYLAKDGKAVAWVKLIHHGENSHVTRYIVDAIAEETSTLYTDIPFDQMFFYTRR